MRLLARISGRLERLSGRRLLFVPVCLGLGVGAYFQLPVEPAMVDWTLLGLAATVFAGFGLYLTRGRFAGLGFLSLGVAVIGVGIIAGGLRSASVSAPVLDFRYYGPVAARDRGVQWSVLPGRSDPINGCHNHWNR